MEFLIGGVVGSLLTMLSGLIWLYPKLERNEELNAKMQGEINAMNAIIRIRCSDR